MPRSEKSSTSAARPLGGDAPGPLLRGDSGLTPQQETQIDVAEYELHRLGLVEARVLHRGDLAVIDAPAKDLSLIATSPLRGEVFRAVAAAGFAVVALSLAGRE